MFVDFVDNNLLLDVLIAGTRFTWSNFQEDPTPSKLDRFLVSMSWKDLFSLLEVFPMARPGSDHIPIVLRGGAKSASPRPFRFQAMWTLFPGFGDLIGDWWQSFMVKGPLGQRFRLTLKLLRKKLRAWNMDVFRRIDRRIKAALENIRVLDSKEEREGLLDEDRVAREQYKMDYERALSMEELMWKQKSRV